MSGTGLLLFFILGPIGLAIIMFLRLGKPDTLAYFASVGIERAGIKEQVHDVIKNFIVALAAILWFMLWLWISGGSHTQPSILLVLIKWPVGIRLTNTIILAIVAVPFLLVEASWIRGLLMSKTQWSTSYKRTATMLFALFAKFAIVALLTIISIFATTSVGVLGGRIVLIGVIWVRILIIQVLAAVITLWTSWEFENTWSAVIVIAFVLSTVLVTTLPIV